MKILPLIISIPLRPQLVKFFLRIGYLPCLFFVGWKYLVYQLCINVVGDLQLVIKDVFNQTINKIKDECKGITWGLITKL
jgi:hypothetical protein